MALSKKTIKYIKKNCNCDLSGKTVLVTGANSGVGFKTVETLVYLGASVIMACRNSSKAEAARNSLLIDYPDADIKLMSLDISDFDSIDSFVEEVGGEVDVFVNNAGVFHHPGKNTKNGLPMVIGTNFFGVYYLSEKLLPKLHASGKEVIYINTISLIHKFAKIDYQHFYDNKNEYSRSKLCLARYTEYLARVYKNSNIHILMNHPGMAITQIAAHVFGKLYWIADYVPFNSAEKSSLSVVWILSHKVEDGSVIGPNKGFGGWGYPQVNKKVKRALKGIDELVEFTKEAVKKIKNNN